MTWPELITWRKEIAEWRLKDTVYLSVPFTWLVAEAEVVASAYRAKGLTVRMGGPGFVRPTWCEGFEPITMHNPLATFTTRGCPNCCSFCAVPKIEPEFREMPDFRPAPIVCDNNILAASRKHLERVIDALKVYPYVDFNQGLEAGRFTPEIADLFGYLRFKARFAFDSWGQEAKVKDAIDLCRKRSTPDIGVYCLIGFEDTPESAQERLELVRSWGVRPNPMRYQPLNAAEKDAYIAPGWTERELKNMMRYYSRLRYLEHIPYEEYNQTPQMELML